MEFLDYNDIEIPLLKAANIVGGDGSWKERTKMNANFSFFELSHGSHLRLHSAVIITYQKPTQKNAFVRQPPTTTAMSTSGDDKKLR